MKKKNISHSETRKENEFVMEITGHALSWIGLKIGSDGRRIWVDDMKSKYQNLQCKYTVNETGITLNFRVGKSLTHRLLLLMHIFRKKKPVMRINKLIISDPVSDNTCVYIDGTNGTWHSRDCNRPTVFTCQRPCCGL